MSFYEKAEQERAAALCDAFIAHVSADHNDTIVLSRDHACHIRNELLRLRKKAKELRAKEDSRG